MSPNGLEGGARETLRAVQSENDFGRQGGDVKMLMLATWDGRFGPGPFGGYHLWQLGSFLVWLLVLGLLGMLLVTLLRRRDDLARTQATGPAQAGVPAAAEPTPLEVVKLRYARGELTKDEFEALKRDLE